MKTVVVIPAYNEEQRIATVLEKLLGDSFEVVVVDDGSDDQTMEIALSSGAFVLRHETNLGQGAALRTGTLWGLKNGYDYIAHFDADGQHRIEDLKNLLGSFKKGEHQVVLGSRFLEQNSSIPPKKKFILALAKIFSKYLLKLRFSDPQSGLRVLKREVVPLLLWQNDDYLHCTEILCLIEKKGINFREESVIINYDDYSTTKKIKPKITMGIKLFWEKLINRL